MSQIYFEQFLASARAAARRTVKCGHAAGDYERGINAGLIIGYKNAGKLEPWEVEYINNVDMAITYKGISA